MGPSLTLVVTANIVFTTLGLFDHKVFFDERSSSLRLIEGGVGRENLGKGQCKFITQHTYDLYLCKNCNKKNINYKIISVIYSHVHNGRKA